MFKASARVCEISLGLMSTLSWPEAAKIKEQNPNYDYDRIVQELMNNAFVKALKTTDICKSILDLTQVEKDDLHQLLYIMACRSIEWLKKAEKEGLLCLNENGYS